MSINEYGKSFSLIVSVMVLEVGIKTVRLRFVTESHPVVNDKLFVVNVVSSLAKT